MQKKKFLFTASLLLFFQCVFSQVTTGSIDGIIIDEKGRYFGGVVIKLSGDSLLGTRTLVSGEKGKFRFISIPVGNYQVILEHDGMKKVILKNIRVRLGRNTSIGEIRVSPSTMQTHEIEVMGRRGQIDYIDSSSGGNITNDQISALPAGRDYKSLITAFAGVNESFYGDLPNISGATGVENVFYINSINVTDPNGTGSGLNLPFNFIREIEVKKGGYQAEYGRTMGGIVNVITQSGSNRFTGNLFGFFTDQHFVGTRRMNVLDLTEESYSDYDFGFSLGGPVIRDRLWYFLAYNRKYENSEIRFPDIGIYPQKSMRDMFAVKLNWKLFRNTDISFTTLGDPGETLHIRNSHPLTGSVKSLIDPDTILGKTETGGLSASLSLKSFLTDELLFEADASYYENLYRNTGRIEESGDEPLFINALKGEWSGGYGSIREQQGSRFSMGIRNTIFLQNHQIKFGIEYEENRYDEYWKMNDPGVIFKLGEGLYGEITMNRDFVTVNKVPSVFIQDSWEIGKQIQLNLGLRWESQYIYDADGILAQQITGMWQPRVGFTFSPGQNFKTKIWGSTGRYYHIYQGIVGQYYLGIHLENAYNLYLTDPRDPDAEIFTTPFDASNTYYDRVHNLKGHHYDEYTLGISTIISRNLNISLQGIHREVREVFGVGIILVPNETGGEDTVEIGGNWGEGELSFLPDPKREYSALTLSLAKGGPGKLNFNFSYTLSRSYGNYGGLYDQSNPFLGYLSFMSLQYADQIENNMGLLPNDRTHILKLSGIYRFNPRLSLGFFSSVMSGTPLNEMWDNQRVPSRWIFTLPRGTAGRTPTLFDLNLRFTWSPDIFRSSKYGLKFHLDMLHIRNWESAQPLLYDQLKYIGADVDEEGIPLNPSPGYGQVLRYQNPMKIRLGVEFSFGKE